MKNKYLWVAACCFLYTLLFTEVACDRPNLTTPYSGGTNNTAATPTPSGPTTITVSTGSSSSSVSGFIYTSSSGTNGTGGVLSLTAHVGDVIILPGSSFHPLYFDGGTSTCIYTAATTNQTYTFPSTGIYYFHCGNHASGCSTGNGACGSTNCSAMAGFVTVN
ncbi:MAG TPA: hypothetical protein VJ873_06745 [bacterium]|nr:hypothetical protein [bacterium]